MIECFRKIKKNTNDMITIFNSLFLVCPLIVLGVMGGVIFSESKLVLKNNFMFI